jgi:competence protein ComEC
LLLPFALGIAWADAGGPGPGLAALIAAAGAALWSARLPSAPPWSARLPSARWCRCGAALARAGEAVLGLGLGLLALGLRLDAPVPGPLAGPVALRLLDAPHGDGRGCRVPAWIGGARPGRARLELAGEDCAWLPGARAAGMLELLELRGARNPGGADVRRRAARRGLHARARVAGPALVHLGDAALSPGAALARARRHIARVLDPATRPTRAGALLRALVLGDTSRIDGAVRDAFSRSGTAHLLSVSGLHVAWVLAVTQISVGWLLRRAPWLACLRRARSGALAAGLLAALAYAALTGPAVPALRSAAMALAGAVAIALGRHPASWNALAAAALVVLASDPAVLFEASFWLSFGAVAGLLAWRIPRGRLAPLLHSTFAAGLATAPLLAGFGLPLPLGTLLANALLVPLVGIALVPPGLVVGVWAALRAAPDDPLLRVLRALAELSIRLAEQLESPDLLAAARHPALLGLALALLGFAARARVLGARRSSPCLVAGAALVVAEIWLGPRQWIGEPRAIFLDVGHGDAVLLQAGASAWLVDAGGRAGTWDAGRGVVLPALRALGVRRLDALAVTHPDLDHVGGAEAVLAGLPVGELWVTPLLLQHEEGWRLRRRAAARRIPVRVVARGDRLGGSGLALDVLWPPADAHPRSSNGGSLVLRARTPELCLSLPGDATAEVERALAAEHGACDVLKLAHHGSLTSSDPVWLDELRPRLAIASAGERRRSPLPHPRVRARLDERGVRLEETRRSGALELALGRRTLEISGWAEPPRALAAPPRARPQRR